MTGFTRYCTTGARVQSVESLMEFVKFLLSVLFGQGRNLLSIYNGLSRKSVFQSREYPSNSLKQKQKVSNRAGNIP